MFNFNRVFLLLGLILLFSISNAQPYIEATLDVGRGPIDLVCDTIDDKVFVACQNKDSVYVINAETNTVIDQIGMPYPAYAICWNPNDNRIFVACAPIIGTGEVVVINPANHEIEGYAPVGETPSCIIWTATSNKVYCANVNNSVTVIDGAPPYSVINVLGVGQSPSHMVWNATNNKLYVSSGAYGAPGRVRIISCVNDSTLKTLNSGRSAARMTWDPIDNRVFVCNKETDNVSVIDGVLDSIIATINVGDQPEAIFWTNPNLVHVGCYWSDDVYVIHGESLNVVFYYPIPGHPSRMLFNPNTTKLFIASAFHSFVLAMDGRREHVGEQIVNLNVQHGPIPMSLYPRQNRIFVGCNWGSQVVVIKDMVGIEEDDSDDLINRSVSVQVYPSIVAKNQSVQFCVNGFKPTELSIYRIDGTRVYQVNNRANWSWALQDQKGNSVTAGLYFARLIGDNNRAVVKFLVR